MPALSRYGVADKAGRDGPRGVESVISPLVGKMAGRPEGGAVAPTLPFRTRRRDPPQSQYADRHCRCRD
ncbi:MAG: hypothetical protein E5V41_32900 [Mesorhizobium sp.]|nr:MAG: hypothetical protein E5V41_32900 [Mesorhizobium sp.]